MKVGLITYDCRHLKTEQVALQLWLTGRHELAFYALPFVERPSRPVMFAHRPDMQAGAHPAAVAQALGADYATCAGPDQIPTDDCAMFLILGAGLLPPAFVSRTAGRVLNAHPGLIPAVRGLDAFKWAVFDAMEVGNSLHFIDEEADAGELIATHATPVFRSDTLESFARRHYELEIAMLAGFDRYLDRPLSLRPKLTDREVRPARMRMPADKQQELPARFDLYKDRYARA